MGYDEDPAKGRFATDSPGGLIFSVIMTRAGSRALNPAAMSKTYAITEIEGI